MKTQGCTEESFLRDVAQHQMTVIHDAGELRHIRFGRPGDSNMHFNVTTVPGYLMFTGDMGAWSFSRLRDMFEFFRGKEEGPLRINRQYWSEKLIAASCTGRFDGSATEYSEELFKSALWREALSLARRMKESGVSAEHRAEMLKELRWVRDAGTNEHAAHQAAHDFEYRAPTPESQRRGLRYFLTEERSDRAWGFTDFYENNLRTYTYHFIWACYAIAWAIRVYDASKAVAEAA